MPACALVAAGAVLGGCSLGGDDEAERTRTVEVTTRVEVFADDGARSGAPSTRSACTSARRRAW